MEDSSLMNIGLSPSTAGMLVDEMPRNMNFSGMNEMNLTHIPVASFYQNLGDQKDELEQKENEGSSLNKILEELAQVKKNNEELKKEVGKLREEQEKQGKQIKLLFGAENNLAKGGVDENITRRKKQKAMEKIVEEEEHQNVPPPPTKSTPILRPRPQRGGKDIKNMAAEMKENDIRNFLDNLAIVVMDEADGGENGGEQPKKGRRTTSAAPNENQQNLEKILPIFFEKVRIPTIREVIKKVSPLKCVLAVLFIIDNGKGESDAFEQIKEHFKFAPKFNVERLQTARKSKMPETCGHRKTEFRKLDNSEEVESAMQEFEEMIVECASGNGIQRKAESLEEFIWRNGSIVELFAD